MFNILENYKIHKLSREYKKETLKYTSQINSFREEERKTGWKGAKKQPIDPRGHFAEKIYPYLIEANEKNLTLKFRELFPPQTEIFYDLTKKMDYVSDIEKIIVLQDGGFLILVNSPIDFNEKKCLVSNVYEVDKSGNFKLHENMYGIGVCPQKKIYCYSTDEGITLTLGWKGEVKSFISWPKDNFYFSDGSKVPQIINQDCMSGETLIPFSDEQRVLVGKENLGLFLLEKEKTTIIYPRISDIVDQDIKIENIFDSWNCSMLHFALSHNNKYIAFGHQSSSHEICNNRGDILSQISPLSSYPHCTSFSKDDQQVAFNSCHFYNGGTLVVNVQDTLNSQEEFYEKPVFELDNDARAYDMISTSFGYIFGDANGYLHARGYDGKYLWDDYLGFNIKTIDISPDEKFLYVGTYKGIIYKMSLNNSKIDPYKIGDSANREICRWMFWERDQILKW